MKNALSLEKLLMGEAFQKAMTFGEAAEFEKENMQNMPVLHPARNRTHELPAPYRCVCRFPHPLFLKRQNNEEFSADDVLSWNVKVL